jgi:hypothetical protein
MSSLHKNDFFSWTLEQEELLRKGNFSAIDSDNLAWELLCMGKSELRALENYYIVYIKHLLKHKYQPEKSSRSWEFSIRSSRYRINKLLKDNPGMKKYLSDVKKDAYVSARLEAAIETGLNDTDFPEEADEWMIKKLDEI